MAKKNIYVLGISYPTYLSGACIFKNSKLLYSSTEERFSRIKNDNSFPINSIKECLKFANIEILDLEKITLNWNPYHGVVTRLYNTVSNNFLSIGNIIFGSTKSSNISTWIKIKNIHKNFSKYFNDKNIYIKKKIYYCDHHTSHIYSSYYFSGFGQSLALSIDGAGESATSVLGYFKKNNFYKLNEVHYPHSLGFFYSTITQFLGFQPDNHEYKVMGMAAYGKTYLKEKMDKIISINNDMFKLNLDYFSFYKNKSNSNFYSKKFVNLFGKPKKKQQKFTQYHFDLAYSFQKKFEEIVSEIVIKAVEKTKIRKLTLSGGCGLNGLANANLVYNKIIDDIFIPPWTQDSGGSIGSAISYLTKKNIKNYNKLSNDYLGKEYSNNEILMYAKKNKIDLKFSKDISKKAADSLKKNKIIIWFQGRSEMGPRALGNRSFLANPFHKSIKDKINLVIKKREHFRPFAPSLINKNKFFIKNISNSNFMNTVLKIKKKYLNKFNAVIHIDGTARVHEVDKKSNPKFFKLIKYFKKISGYPIVLNTSLNLKEEPIVENPNQAFKIFKTSKVDGIFIGDFYCIKNDLSKV